MSEDQWRKDQWRKLIGANVRKVRQSQETSLEKLEAKSGVPKSTISDLERGARDTSVVTVARVIAALEVSPSIFFGYKPSIPGEYGLIPAEDRQLLDDLGFIPYFRLAAKLYRLLQTHHSES